MLNKKITDLPTLNELDSTDKLLVCTSSDTYNVTVSILKSAVQDGVLQDNFGTVNAGKVLVVGNDGIVGLKDAGEIGTTIRPLNVSKNGTYAAPANTAYNPVVVDVEGGQSEPVQEKDVNFYDYDGTLVNSYTVSEFALLSALPKNPSHELLVAQGWNWSLADAKTYVAKYGRLNIGQMYDTADGKCYFFIHIDEDTPANRLTFYLRWNQSVSEGVAVNWGDNAQDYVYEGTGAKNYAHPYEHGGDYVITLELLSGTLAFDTDSSNAIYGSTNNSNSYNRGRIRKVYVSDSITRISLYAFQKCYSLTHITIPGGVTSIGGYAFNYCYSLTHITIPGGVTSIGGNTFSNCNSLTSITIPGGVTNIDTNTFSNCYSLTSITIPGGATSIVARIGPNAFNNCYSLTSITIPDGVPNISDYAFNYCYALGAIHFKLITPPTVTNANAFSNLPADCIIYVPAGTLSTYTNAANYPDPNTYTYVEE